jgi:succinate dehydrogenase / fumarate reductase flavoprotein subunit
MGGLWVDYNLMTTIPGLYAIGESNFSDHGANRLGASALMQGLADGYFVLPNTIGDYLAQHMGEAPLGTEDPAFTAVESEVRGRVQKLLDTNGERTVDDFHRQLGLLLWDQCGMERSAGGLRKALAKIPEMREEFHQNVRVLGGDQTVNQSLEKAGRVADFFELAELMCIDALHRDESCGGHFRSEHRTPEGEAKRDDENFRYVAAWECSGDFSQPVLNKEPLEFENVKLTQRSYK